MPLYRCPECGAVADEPASKTRPLCPNHDEGRFWVVRVYRVRCPGSGTKAFGGTRCRGCQQEVDVVDDRFADHTYLTEKP